MGGCAIKPAGDNIPDPNRAYPPAYGDTLIEGILADPATLNPILASDSASFEVLGHIFNSLLRYDKDLNLVGELAESWEVKENGRVLIFRLHKNVKWQDGYPLTAQDIVFTLKIMRDPNTRSAYRSNFENITQYAALDDHTFKVEYQSPFSPALEKIGGMLIIPKHLLEKRDINQADDFAAAPIGSGGFRFVEWKRAESVTLAANPEYFLGRPYLNRVIKRVIPDPAVQFLELQNFALDSMELTPRQYLGEGALAKFTTRYQKFRYPSNQYTYFGFNLNHVFFKSKRFRQAIAMAINKKALVESVLEGLGQIGTGPYTPSSWAYNPKVQSLPYDPNRARELLVEEGFRYQPDGRLVTREGKTVEFTILTNQGNRMREQAATIIQSQLQEIGITVKIRIIAWSSLLSEFINKRQFEAVVMGWALAQDPDPYNIWHSSQTGEHEFNFVSYVNPKVDALIERGRRVFNHRERQTIYQEIHQRIADDLPYVFLYVPDNLPVVHRRVLSIKPALAGIGYNFNEWYVPEGFVRYAQ
jgi:peptide/nickel transport system substrate-binding protein